MCRVYLLHRKAVEHHRTPKRKRNYRVRNGGHVLECGSVLPLLGALSITVLSSQSPPWSPKSSSYVSAPRWRSRRFEVETFAKQIRDRGYNLPKTVLHLVWLI